jgi:taurine dioxygenase/taurine dehydrogenase large subunit
VLTESELEACGFKTRSPITDTRTLRHYYRLLPDNRVQIGSRAAITGKDAANPKHLAALREGLARKFPALRGIDLDYSWWGWVDVSHDMMPRITSMPGVPNAFYSLGYGGNGVMYSAQAGRRMAQLVAGREADIPQLPIFRDELPHEGWKTPFRRLGQWGLYQLYHLQDERA